VAGGEVMPETTDTPVDPGVQSLSLVAILAFLGGYADAGSYVLTGSFTGHLTGNSILLMVNLAYRDWAAVTTCLLAVMMFFAGTALGIRWHPGRATAAGAGRMRLPLLVEFALLAAGVGGLAAFGQAYGGLGFIGCLCLAMGLQNGTLQRLEMMSVHTTYITGMSTTLANVLTSQSKPRPTAVKPERTRNVYLALISCFLAGALAGSVFSIHAGLPGFAGLLVPAAVALVLSILAGRRP
jgi:uncharacterized membrane protein YoaK (UPF0700 family)